MGLIAAALGSVGNTLADQWKEFFYCDALDADTLMVKGQKRTKGNNRGNDNIISNGSIIAVADGQCMIIVEQGKIVEVCAEPGEFVYDTSTEPSIFSGSLGSSILDTFKTIGKRFTFGGDTAKDQRVYYFNTKEIPNNKFGTANPVPFKVVVNEQLGYKLSVDLRCNGTYSYKLTNPLLFYTNVAANVANSYQRSEIDPTLKAELIDALQPALAVLSANGVSYDQIPAHTKELKKALNDELINEWGKRGIEVFSMSMGVPSIPEDQRKKITTWEETAMMRGDAFAQSAFTTTTSAANAATAAANPNGAVNGFMAMNMAGQQGGQNAANLYAAGLQQQQMQQQFAQQQAAQAPAADSWKCTCGAVVTGKFCPECGSKKPEPKPAADAWTCPTCGKQATGKFCPECGTKKPAETADGWTCPDCGTSNKGKFCQNCGTKKPAGAKLYKCDKCGWEPEDPAHPPKFCPECGDPFGDEDVQ
ncbi:MAG: SPFH domain-containing protein [Clostridia bacterium]|jgi:membrane protease subunit (stomatin/prohibitin family)|nr:SPFH domain-containing protein [Clostridia bacterium]